jgi:dihydroorotate dehydrogenase (fumarate)
MYLGLALKNPVVASAGPLTGDLDTLQQLEQAGVAAAVLPSLFEEQICRDEQRVQMLYEFQTHSYGESLSYFPRVNDYNVGPEGYLRMIEAAKQAVPIPVIASLNGSSPGGWARYAKLLQDAGADAIELNIYFVATDPRMTAADVESQYIELVSIVCDVVSIPTAIKIGSQFTNLTNFVPRLAEAGAKGIVMFNRFLEPDFDLEKMQVSPSLVLSNRHELRLPLRWIAILRDQVSLSIAATSGIHYPEDVVKMLLAGADVCMITSTLLRHGIEYAAEMIAAIKAWLDDRGYESVEQLKGSMSYANCPNSGELERANYMKAVVSYTAAG